MKVPSLLIGLILTSTFSLKAHAATTSEEIEQLASKNLLSYCPSYSEETYNLKIQPLLSNFSSYGNFTEKFGTDDKSAFDQLMAGLNTLHCPANRLSEFKIALQKIRLSNQLNYLEKVKENIFLLRKKKLGGSFYFARYYDYIAANSLEKYVKKDEEINRLYSANKDSFLKREASCGNTINLRAPLSLSKPKDQGSIGWCYAFTASDLVAHALKKDVSAMYMAILFNDKFFSKAVNLAEGGFTSSTIREVAQNGTCLEKDLPSMNYKFAESGYTFKDLYKEMLELSKKFYYDPVSLGGQFNSKKYKVSDVVTSLTKNHAPLLAALKEIFPKVDTATIAEALIEYKGTIPFKRLARASCAIIEDSETQRLKVQSVLRDSKVYDAIDDQLSKGNIVAVAYNMKILMNFKTEENSSHASSIVGRRFNKKTMSCEYLLRNSWGSCQSYYSLDYQCENGHIWISEDAFKYSKAITRVDYIETN